MYHGTLGVALVVNDLPQITPLWVSRGTVSWSGVSCELKYHNEKNAEIFTRQCVTKVC